MRDAEYIPNQGRKGYFSLGLVFLQRVQKIGKKYQKRLLPNKSIV